MNTMLISYDLGLPESSSDYQNLIYKIKSFGAWCHPLESFWFVKTDLGPVQVRKELTPFLDYNDELLCIDVTGNGRASCNLSEEMTDWMEANL